MLLDQEIIWWKLSSLKNNTFISDWDALWQKFQISFKFWFKKFLFKNFAKYYQEQIYRCSKYLSSPPSIPLSIASPFLRLNKDIQIENECAIFSNFSKSGTNFVAQLFDRDGKLHCCEFLKEKYLSSQNMKLTCFKLIHTLPREWKEAISVHDRSPENLLVRYHHPIKKNQMLCLAINLTSKLKISI